MKEVVAKKEMDDPQRKILGFMKKHKGRLLLNKRVCVFY